MVHWALNCLQALCCYRIDTLHGVQLDLDAAKAQTKVSLDLSPA
ncbi:hypothetical protein [Snodgrassella sp. CFCC 13594]|nr:hypothetical protein [Snodgrassella sp. CFCC 13594]